VTILARPHPAGGPRAGRLRGPLCLLPSGRPVAL